MVPKATLKRQVLDNKPGAISTARKLSKKKNTHPSSVITKPSDYSQFLSEEVHQTTVTAWDTNSHQGKKLVYPSASALATDRNSFGSISPAHSFLKEPSFDNIVVFLLKSNLLDFQTFLCLINSNPLYLVLWKYLVKLHSLEFSDLRIIDTSYQSQEEIPQHKVIMFLACALHYNLDLASVIRYIGGNYTSAHTDIKSIILKLEELGFDPNIIQHLYRSRTFGCPAYFNAETSHDNFLAFLHYGNHSTILQHCSTVIESLNKEVKHCHVVPFPRWVARFCPNLHLTPQGILLKQNKKPRMIWDGSFKPAWWCKNINSSRILHSVQILFLVQLCKITSLESGI